MLLLFFAATNAFSQIFIDGVELTVFVDDEDGGHYEPTWDYINDTSVGTVGVTGGTFTNMQTVSGGVTMSGASFYNAGTVSGGVVMTGSSFYNTGTVSGGVNLSTGYFENFDGIVNGNVSISGTAMFMQGSGQLGDVTINGAGANFYTGFDTIVTGDVTMNGERFDNQGAVQGRVTVENGYFDNDGGSVGAVTLGQNGTMRNMGIISQMEYNGGTVEDLGWVGTLNVNQGNLAPGEAYRIDSLNLAEGTSYTNNNDYFVLENVSGNGKFVNNGGINAWGEVGVVSVSQDQNGTFVNNGHIGSTVDLWSGSFVNNGSVGSATPHDNGLVLFGGEFTSNEGSTINKNVVNNGGTFISNGATITGDVENNGGTFISNGTTITGNYVQYDGILQILASTVEAEIFGFGIESTNPALTVLGLFDLQGGTLEIDLTGYNLGSDGLGFNLSDFISAGQYAGLNSNNVTLTGYDTELWTDYVMTINESGDFGVVFNGVAGEEPGLDPEPETPSSTPEPATLLMLSLGLGAIPFARRFRKAA